MGGKVETKHTASGFGKHVIVRAKPYDAYFGHLSKWLVKMDNALNLVTLLVFLVTQVQVVVLTYTMK